MLCSYRVCQILLQGIPSVESEEELVWLRQSCIGSATKELKCLLTLCLAVVTAFLFFFFSLLSELLVWHGIWPQVQLLSTARLSYKSHESVITEVGHWNFQSFSCDAVVSICDWSWSTIQVKRAKHWISLNNICWTILLFCYMAVLLDFRVSGQLARFSGL